MSNTDLKRVADRWSNEDTWETPGLYWLQLDAVHRRWNMKMSGRADADWVDHALNVHLAGRLPLARCLSLGCGTGRLERQLAALGAFVACDAYDIANGSIQKARQAAAEAGYEQITYYVDDMNTIGFAQAQYDAVWAAGSVHHVTELEHLFDQVAAALKPGGLFVLNEYIGPTRFQFPARQRQIIQACNDLLPDEYKHVVAARLQLKSRQPGAAGRRSLMRRLIAKLKDGDLLPALRRRAQRVKAQQTGKPLLRASANLPTAASVAAIDPSEAIRSADIMPVLREYFDIVEFRPLGGAILQFLLADIAGNFETGEGAQMLEMLFEIEDALMDYGDLPSDFAYIVAQPRRDRADAPTIETKRGWK